MISFAQPGLAPRDLMLGMHAFGAARAFHYETVIKEKLIKDHVGAEPVVLVVGPDNQSIRAFHARIPAVEKPVEFYRNVEGSNFFLLDDATGSKWDFQGCAIEGSAKGTCLERLEVIKDYWFDWKNYNPNTTVFGQAAR